MLELCQPPDPNTRQPKFKLPAGATDCHVHTYGPDSKYPVSPKRMFDVPEALPKQLASVLNTMGVDRVVLVQPSTYGTDNSRQLDAVAEMGRPTRIVASLRADVSDEELERLHKAGVRGVRYAIGHKAGAPLEEIPILSPRIAKLGWHTQFHIFNHGGESPLQDAEALLPSLATDMVIDHIGSIDPRLGLKQQGFQALGRLLKSGRCWIKLSCGYRVSSEALPYRDLIPYVNELISIRSDRLVWASDWPHVAFEGQMPNTTDLLDHMLDWIPDEAIRQKVFVKNPEVLYGF